MAKINFGVVVNDARGKINGNVFSKNRSGAYVRRKVTPTNPATIYQAQARSYLAIFSQQWSGTLTDAQRATWTAFANTYPILNVFGLAVALNGLNMLVRINTALSQIGATPITDPPASPATTPIPINPGSFAYVGGVGSFTQTAAAPTAGTLFYVFQTPGLPVGRNASQSDYRFIGTVAPTAGPYPVTHDLPAGSTTRFGTIVPGLKTYVLVSTIDPTVGIPTVGQPMVALTS